jgi:hypothetical protein
MGQHHMTKRVQGVGPIMDKYQPNMLSSTSTFTSPWETKPLNCGIRWKE